MKRGDVQRSVFPGEHRVHLAEFDVQPTRIGVVANPLGQAFRFGFRDRPVEISFEQFDDFFLRRFVHEIASVSGPECTHRCSALRAR